MDPDIERLKSRVFHLEEAISHIYDPPPDRRLPSQRERIATAVLAGYRAAAVNLTDDEVIKDSLKDADALIAALEGAEK